MLNRPKWEFIYNFPIVSEPNAQASVASHFPRASSEKGVWERLRGLFSSPQKPPTPLGVLPPAGVATLQQMLAVQARMAAAHVRSHLFFIRFFFENDFFSKAHVLYFSFFLGIVLSCIFRSHYKPDQIYFDNFVVLFVLESISC